MKLLDLGEIDTPVLLFGGPYSNLQATEAIFAEAQARGIAADNMICTGDVVAYCASPQQTVAAIRAAGVHVVVGNCEKQLAAGAMDCGCGFEEGSACDVLSAGWFAHANAHVDADDRLWMGDLPDALTFSQNGKRFAVVHGGFTDVSRFIWPNSHESVFMEEVRAIESVAGKINAVIAGHCGMAFMRHMVHIEWINAGVIGMPPNQGADRTEFAVLETGEVTLHELKYDAAAARQDMVNAGLVQGYHDGLISGYWPSEDVLPPELRRAAVASG